jgi:hypothetical protein
MQDVQKTSCTLLSVFREWRFVPGGATRVPAGRNCCNLFCGTATPIGNKPVAQAALSQKKGRVAATRFVSRKNELPRRF